MSVSRRFPCQEISYIPRLIICYESALVHNHNFIGHSKELFQPVLGNNNRRTQIPVDSVYGFQEFSGRYRVKLRCRLVQNQHLWLHYHD